MKSIMFPSSPRVPYITGRLVAVASVSLTLACVACDRSPTAPRSIILGEHRSAAQPAVLGAQQLAATLKAESVTAEFMRIVGANALGTGADRIQMATQWDGAGADIRLLAPDGQTNRVVISSGGINVPDPDGAGMNVYNQSGVVVARLGMGRGPQGNQPLANLLFLTDQDGRRRIVLSVDQNGTPSIKLLDAQGNVTWQTP